MEVAQIGRTISRALNINEDLTEELRREIQVHYVSMVDDVMKLALSPPPQSHRPANESTDVSAQHETVQ